MKSILKRGLALFLVVMLLIPNLPVLANELPQQLGDSLSYNLGDYETVMLSPEDESLSWENWTKGKDTYILELETDAFFPYEVQFSYNGKTFTEWFMTPDDIVEVGDYKFGVHSEVTGTKVTQLKLDISGKEVVVYPERKTFKESLDHMMSVASLLPLEEKELYVDLRDFTPVELTRVSIASIFAGERELAPNANVSWKRLTLDATDNNDESYEFATVSGNEVMDANNSYMWEMIVGTIDQLDMSNIRYIVYASKESSSSWMSASAYTQDENGVRENIPVMSCSYYSYGNEQFISLSSKNLGNTTAKVYISLQLSEQFASKNLKVFEGKYDNAEEAMQAKDITNQIFCDDMSVQNAGYLTDLYKYDNWVTFISYGENQSVTGVLPVRLYVGRNFTGIDLEYGVYQKNENGLFTSVSSIERDYTKDGIIVSLPKGNSANKVYYVSYDYFVDGKNYNTSVKAAYKGNFNSISEAEASGQQDIKEQLFDSDIRYGDDFSGGVEFTIFTDSDDESDPIVWHESLTIKESDKEVSTGENGLYSGTAVTFEGLRDAEENHINSYCVDGRIDSYGSYNFKTILVDDDVDLSKIAPVFYTSTGVRLYAEDLNVPEESGKSVHDFTGGILQYRAAAENGSGEANYWLQIIKKEQGSGKLYINSLKDEESKTETKDGVVYSTREVLIDEFHNNKHDILLANIGTEDIDNLGVTLESDVVELDPYWTLTGNNKLSGFSTLYREGAYGELPNLAKLRLTMKDGVEKGTDVAGKLTIVSGNTPLVVLNLTGTVGNPKITTKEIPQAVKYVPYGSMIFNNNKYDWNKVTYEMVSGKLPEGVTLKENGELYGVPKEFGEFKFTVQMKNSYSSFSSDRKTFIMTVLDNTDDNVNAANDEGYGLSKKIGDITNSDTNASYILVSEGVFDEFEKVYLDGNELGSDDYSAESGSTRITIKAQTLKKLDAGSHTIGVEFRTGENKLQVKRAAQNVRVTKSNTPSYPQPPVNPQPPIKPDDNGNKENTGNNDNKGDTGNTENKGDNGNTGNTDNKGDTGNTENKGDNGNTGNTGDSGNAGTNDSSEGNKLIEVLKATKAQKKVVKNNKSYFLDKKGKTIKNSFVVTQKGNIVYTNKKGIMVKGRGLTAKNGKRYYAKKNGVIAVNGFFKTELGNTVYATKTGALKANKAFSVKGKQYVAKKSGALVKNQWFTIGKKKYFCDKKGVVKKVK